MEITKKFTDIRNETVKISGLRGPTSTSVVRFAFR